MSYEKQHELKEVREIIEKSFELIFGTEDIEILIYLGGNEEIAHCGYLIFDERTYETIVEFQVSSYGIYDGKMNTISTYYLRKFLEFKERVKGQLEND